MIVTEFPTAVLVAHPSDNFGLHRHEDAVVKIYYYLTPAHWPAHDWIDVSELFIPLKSVGFLSAGNAARFQLAITLDPDFPAESAGKSVEPIFTKHGKTQAPPGRRPSKQPRGDGWRRGSHPDAAINREKHSLEQVEGIGIKVEGIGGGRRSSKEHEDVFCVQWTST